MKTKIAKPNGIGTLEHAGSRCWIIRKAREAIKAMKQVREFVRGRL